MQKTITNTVTIIPLIIALFNSPAYAYDSHHDSHLRCPEAAHDTAIMATTIAT